MSLRTWLLVVVALVAAQGCGATRRYVIERSRGTMDETANTTSTSDPSWSVQPARARR